MERAQLRALAVGIYYEVHHIQPKSEGGSNEVSNLANLTAREHFLAHWLLVRIEPTPARVFSFNMMCNLGPAQRLYQYTPSSRAVAEAREQHSRHIQKIMKGKQVSEKTRALISEKKKGWVPSKEWRKKKSDSLKGGKISEEQKQKISATSKGRKKPDGFGAKIAESNRKLKSKGTYVTPEGIFATAEAAAKANKCSPTTTWNRCKNSNFPEWGLIKK
jgi:hypothetical protein